MKVLNPNKLIDSSRKSHDQGTQLDNIVKAPINLERLINWILRNESSFCYFDIKSRNEDHPCVRLYNKTVLSNKGKMSYVESNRAKFGRQTQLAGPIVNLNRTAEMNMLSQTSRDDDSKPVKMIGPALTMKSVNRMMKESQFKFKKKVISILKDIHRYPKMK